MPKYVMSCKICHDFEEYCIWKGQATNVKVCKKCSTFLALNNSYKGWYEPHDEPGSWLSQFISVSLVYRKKNFCQFLLLLK